MMTRFTEALLAVYEHTEFKGSPPLHPPPVVELSGSVGAYVTVSVDESPPEEV